MSNELPQGWDRRSLAEVIDEFQPGFASGEKNVKGGISHLRMNNIGLSGELVLDLVRTVPEKLAKPHHNLRRGDVLVCTTNSGKLVGKCALFDLPGCYVFSNHLTRLRPKAGLIDGEFLRWNLWLLWKSGAFDDQCKHWVNQSSISKDALLETEIILPPFLEQQRIVAKLEALLAKVDACRQRLEKIPTLLKRFRQSVLAAACSGRLTDDWRGKNLNEKSMDFGSPSDYLPDSWRECPLIKLVRVTAGEAFKKSEYSLSGVRLLQIANVSFGRIIWGQENFLPVSYLKSHSDLVLNEGDILVALNRPLLNWNIKAARLSKSDLPAILYQRVGKFHFIGDGKSINSDFLFLFLRSNVFIHELSDRLRGTDQPYINPPEMLEIFIPVPPLSEQHEIVRRVEDLFKIADRIEERYQRAKTQVERLTQSILAKAFRGELVPQDPNDEPASILLDRIRQQRISGNQSKSNRAKRKFSISPSLDERGTGGG